MEVLKKGVEAKMDGLKNDMEYIEEKMKDNMEDMKNDLKVDKEGLKEYLTKLTQEMTPNDEKMVEENHDENKINVSLDFIHSNLGLKTYHIPNIDMRKFDGKDAVTWILNMEQYFDLNNVQNAQKVCIATLYLEKITFVWYQWFFSRKKMSLGKFLWRK